MAGDGEEVANEIGEDNNERIEEAAATAAKAKRKKKKRKGKNDATQDHEVMMPASWEKVKIAALPGKGRAVVAARDLRPGEVAFSEVPWALTIASQKADKFCAKCCRALAEQGAMAGVSSVRYCSAACERCDRQVLLASAQALPLAEDISTKSDVDIDLTRMLLQLLVRRYFALRAGGNTGSLALGAASDTGHDTALGGREVAAEELRRRESCTKLLEDTLTSVQAAGGPAAPSAPPAAAAATATAAAAAAAAAAGGLDSTAGAAAGYRNLMSLVYHPEHLEQPWVAAVSAAAEQLRPLLPAAAADFSTEEAVALAARVNANAHGLTASDGSNATLGCGMFPLVAMINHSCRPNCAFVFRQGRQGQGPEGACMEVRVLEAVAAGKELTVAYIDLLQSTPDRRRELLQSRHFECSCDRCENPSHADTLLAAFCCARCGPSGLVVRPEALSTLADALGLLDDLEAHHGGPSKGKGKGSKPKGKNSASGAGNETNGSGSGPVSGGGGGGSGGGGSGDSGGGGSGGAQRLRAGTVFHASAESELACSSCQATFSVAQAAATVQKACDARSGPDAAMRSGDYRTARRLLQSWLEEFDAATAVPGRSGSNSGSQGGSAGAAVMLRLNPSHAAVLSALAALANCCRAEQDYAAAARHLGRVVKAMEALYPNNFNELQDFRCSWAEALEELLKARGSALPRRMKDQACRELVAATTACAAARAVCVGPQHPSTVAAAAAAGRARALMASLR